MAKNSFVAEVTFKKKNIERKVISPPQLYLHDETVLVVLFPETLSWSKVEFFWAKKNLLMKSESKCSKNQGLYYG